MSGSQAQQGVGALGLVGAIGAAPFTGGFSLLAVPGSLGLLANGTRQQNAQQNRAQRALGNSLIQPIKNTTPLPTTSDAAVQQARNNKLMALQSQSGRSSTWLSGTQGTKTTFGS